MLFKLICGQGNGALLEGIPAAALALTYSNSSVGMFIDNFDLVVGVVGHC
jgi:hypothetical protein